MTAIPSPSNPKPLYSFYFENSKWENVSWIELAVVIVKQAAITFTALGFSFYMTKLFGPGLFFGMAFQEQLEKPFDRIHRVFNIHASISLPFTIPLYVTTIKRIVLPIFAALFLIGAVLSIPDTWLLGAFFLGLWCGKRLVNLADHRDGKNAPLNNIN